MMKEIIIFWFKRQAAKAAPAILMRYYSSTEVQEILHSYWNRYLQLRLNVPIMPTLGGSVAVNLAAMSTAFYRELNAREQSAEITSQLFYEIAWQVYRKMGRFSWWIAKWGNPTTYSRLNKATLIFRAFPFNSPSYVWEDVLADTNIVSFNCTKCPVAEYFQTQGLSKFCTQTWCALDFPLAELWHSKLERSGSIAGGATVCDFRWKVELINQMKNEKYERY